MINPTELRLGNLVLWNHRLANPESTLPQAWVEVTSIHENKLGYISPRVEQRVEPFEDDLLPLDSPYCKLEEFEPIRLTAALVEQCGFVGSAQNNGFFTYTKEPLHVIVQNDNTVLVKLERRELPCTSLHQLQNLYFAFTGDELRIMREE